MRLTTDDDALTVSNVFLGPKGYRLPFQARYSAYGIGFGLLVALVAIERRIGIPMGIWTTIYTVVVVVFLTRTIGRFIDFERPVRSIVTTFVHEVTAPRPLSRGHTAELCPGRLAPRKARRE